MNESEQKEHFDKFKKYFRKIWLEAEIAISVPVGSRRHYREFDSESGDFKEGFGLIDGERVDSYALKVYDGFTGLSGVEFTFRWNRIVASASKLNFPKFTIEMVMDGMRQGKKTRNASGETHEEVKASLESIDRGYALEEKELKKARESGTGNISTLGERLRKTYGTPKPKQEKDSGWDDALEVIEEMKKNENE